MTVRLSSLVFSFVALACTPRPLPNPARPASPTQPLTQRNVLQPASWSPFSHNAALPAGPEISTEVLAFVVIRESDRLLAQIANDDPTRASARLLHGGGMDERWSEVIDLKRPVAVALLNPTLLASRSVQPLVGMVPVRSGAALIELLRRSGAKATEWGALVETPAGTVAVAPVHDHAAVTGGRRAQRKTARWHREHREL